jgi:hypothetical protein
MPEADLVRRETIDIEATPGMLLLPACGCHDSGALSHDATF